MTAILVNVHRKIVINKDSVKNHYGSRLLDLHVCKGNDLFIINGRIGNDKGIGKLTCKNSSVVDYVISCVDFFKHTIFINPTYRYI
jgi:acid phosphatase class B